MCSRIEFKVFREVQRCPKMNYFFAVASSEPMS